MQHVDVACFSRPKDGLKLAVFDFDSTLTTFHVFASLAGCATTPDNKKLEVPPPYARSERGQMSRLCALDADIKWGPGVFAFEAFGGPDRVAQLHDMLRELREQNVECVVLSKGMEATIMKCLKQVKLSMYFTDVVGNTGCSMGAEDFDTKLKYSEDIPGAQTVVDKSENLRTLMVDRRLHGSQAVLIDDEASTIETARSTCRTIHVDSGSGIQEKEIQLVRDMLE
jgi:hypothetical protein